ncbi:hypothetical protein EZ449_03595 [Pedobacter frigidisoli]|uniref:SMI1-KNR4 cell-wall n=1 Tax=Pedobacter frigidisoli TaxID=2530455 RepID=A0A4R0P5F1_9SPHI|nr:hypothetical protein [Pedobacter frigidisoli]TCD12113.1 hypothetical protein EZ449_03595 [Pedobacter frigidisoli]
MEDRTIALMTKYLDGDYKVSPMAPQKSTIQDIKNVEKELDINFPDEYIAHLLGENDEVLGSRGIFIEVKEEIWRRPKLYDVAPFWSFLYGFHTFTAFKQSEDWMNLEFVGKNFFADTGIKAVPILKILTDADVYCVGENKQILKYNHEENLVEDTNMNFWEIFEFELKELRDRKELKLKQK